MTVYRLLVEVEADSLGAAEQCYIDGDFDRLVSVDDSPSRLRTYLAALKDSSDESRIAIAERFDMDEPAEILSYEPIAPGQVWALQQNDARYWMDGPYSDDDAGRWSAIDAAAGDEYPWQVDFFVRIVEPGTVGYWVDYRHCVGSADGRVFHSDGPMLKADADPFCDGHGKILRAGEVES